MVPVPKKLDREERASCDDPLRDVVPILEAIQSTAAMIGLAMQPLKCGHLFVPDWAERQAHIQLHGMEIPQMLLIKGIDMLVVPVGTPKAVERLAHIHLDEIMAIGKKALDHELVYA